MASGRACKYLNRVFWVGSVRLARVGSLSDENVYDPPGTSFAAVSLRKVQGDTAQPIPRLTAQQVRSHHSGGP